MGSFEVIVVGGGPAGAACAAFCAAAGLRVLVVERAVFPRDKVCGDCLNPDAWPVLARLGLEDAVRALPHAALRTVEFRGLHGAPVRLPLPERARGEIAVKRSALDLLLLEAAAGRGVEVRQGRAVGAVRRTAAGFEVTLVAPGSPRVPAASFREEAVSKTQEGSDTGSGEGEEAGRGERAAARFLVAADGRNSVVARLTGLLADRRHPATDRVGLQTHVPCPAGFGPRVQMRWFARGYGGLCPVGGGELNVSLAGPPASLAGLKRWAREEFGLAADHAWRTIAPLDRAPAPLAAVAEPGGRAAFLVGDAARVVEPFTGEGIYYALRTGELAAEWIAAAARGEIDASRAATNYRAAHRAAYRGRLWVNRLARLAGRHPRAASVALRALRWQPRALGLLTKKVVR